MSIKIYKSLLTMRDRLISLLTLALQSLHIKNVHTCPAVVGPKALRIYPVTLLILVLVRDVGLRLLSIHLLGLLRFLLPKNCLQRSVKTDALLLRGAIPRMDGRLRSVGTDDLHLHGLRHRPIGRIHLSPLIVNLPTVHLDLTMRNLKPRTCLSWRKT